MLKSPRVSAGPAVEAFESEFATYVGRAYAVAVSSGTLGTLLAIRALGIGPGDEVIASSYGWHQVAHAIVLAGATPVLADIDYWSGCLSPTRVAEKVTEKTRAILAGNANGHPAEWGRLREIAADRGIALIEDSTEAIGSRYLGRMVGSFGDLAVFDFSQPGALVCGEGGMVVTDDPGLASELRYLRNRSLADRFSVSVGSRVPLQATMSDLSAALGLAQLERIEVILARRKQVESYYREHIMSFEGIKPPYLAPDVDEVHWFVYLVHLGTRFTRSGRNQIVERPRDRIDRGGRILPALASAVPLRRTRLSQDPVADDRKDRRPRGGTAVSRTPLQRAGDVHRQDDEGFVEQCRRRRRDLLNQQSTMERTA